MMPDKEVKADYQQFQMLAKKYVEIMLSHHSGEAKKDEICICYQSLSAFVSRFPTAIDRREGLRRLKRANQKADYELKSVESIMRSMEEEILSDDFSENIWDEGF